MLHTLNSFSSAKSSAGTWLYLPGALLVFMGLVVLLAPEILVAIIASILFIAGFGLLSWAHRFRKLSRQSSSTNYEVHIS